jgi:hypothetical protein
MFILTVNRASSKKKIFSSIESVIEHFSTVLYAVLYCWCGVLFINLCKEMLQMNTLCSTEKIFHLHWTSILYVKQHMTGWLSCSSADTQINSQKTHVIKLSVYFPFFRVTFSGMLCRNIKQPTQQILMLWQYPCFSWSSFITAWNHKQCNWINT